MKQVLFLIEPLDLFKKKKKKKNVEKGELFVIFFYCFSELCDDV